MVVQHNLTAMNSNRMLGVTTKTQSKTTEKLSSGYKINRAADDAAGLAISEKMRKQIRGLTQASANAQDGISAVQTAEGALTEVQDMLQRMNELAVKASNGTQSESDRASIQAEIDQLATEIDRVAETTKFNETYLLKGDRNVDKGYSYSYKAVSKNKEAAATMDQDDATKLTAKIIFNGGEGIAKPAAAADQNAVAKALRDQGITITAKQDADKKGATYSVTLNGSAANIYKINTKNNSGTDNGKATTGIGADEKVNFNSSKTAKFEIVDLQGNKIADIEIAGGIGDDIAAESSKVITANTVEAAENAGDVKQFYDADGNAISENALGNYFSKLSEGGGTRTLYAYDPTGATAADKVKAITKKEGTGGLDEANAAKKILYTALAATNDAATDATKKFTEIDISGVEGAAIGDKYVYGNDGEWHKDSATGDIVKGIKTKGGSLENGIAINVDSVDFKSVANLGTATIVGDMYKDDGTKLTSEELTEALNGDSKAYEKYYTKNPKMITEVKQGADAANGTKAPTLSGDIAIADGVWKYTAAAGSNSAKWERFADAAAADAGTAVQETWKEAQMSAAISNYSDLGALTTGYNFKVGNGVETGAASVTNGTGGKNLDTDPVLKDGMVLEAGTWSYDNTSAGSEWKNTASNKTLSIAQMTAVVDNYGDLNPAKNDEFTVIAATIVPDLTSIQVKDVNKDALYYYELSEATLEVDAVAPQAGKQLYDAVGNALDGAAAIGGGKRLTMAEAAKEVAANKNLTGALGLNLHVGADATKNNQIDLKIEAMSAKGLGINGIRVDGRTDSNALNSIGTIKEALAKVSAQRSQLGAVQNRLEHTINNLDNVVENTTSAESAIRDTDMATTMVQFSNNNILTQAGTSMLAQANQSNQSVLSLLQ